MAGSAWHFTTVREFFSSYMKILIDEIFSLVLPNSYICFYLLLVAQRERTRILAEAPSGEVVGARSQANIASGSRIIPMPH